MSCRSVHDSKSSFTPYGESHSQNQTPLINFSRLNLYQSNELNSSFHMPKSVSKDEYREHSVKFSMKSHHQRKRKGVVSFNLKESRKGNTFLGNSLIGKNSVDHDLFDQGYDSGADEQRECSEIIGPVYQSQSNNRQPTSSDDFKLQSRLYIDVEVNKPKFHKTKNLLRTISSYFHKFLLHSQRSREFQEKYFRNLYKRQQGKKQKGEKDEKEEKEVISQQKMKQQYESNFEDSRIDEEPSSQQSLQQMQQMMGSIKMDNYLLESHSPQISRMEISDKLKLSESDNSSSFNNQSPFIVQQQATTIIATKQQKKSSLSHQQTVTVPIPELSSSVKSKMKNEQKDLKSQQNDIKEEEKDDIKEQQSSSQQQLQNDHKQQNNESHEFHLQTQQEFIKENIENLHKWVSDLSMINFADYEQVWSIKHRFSPLYRQASYKYYKEQVYCDIMRSRITFKNIANQCMPQLIQGLFKPKSFYRFK